MRRSERRERWRTSGSRGFGSSGGSRSRTSGSRGSRRRRSTPSSTRLSSGRRCAQRTLLCSPLLCSALCLVRQLDCKSCQFYGATSKLGLGSAWCGACFCCSGQRQRRRPLSQTRVRPTAGALPHDIKEKRGATSTCTCKLGDRCQFVVNVHLSINVIEAISISFVERKKPTKSRLGRIHFLTFQPAAVA